MQVFIVVLCALLSAIPSQSIEVQPCSNGENPVKSSNVEGCSAYPCEYTVGNPFIVDFTFESPLEASELKSVIEEIYDDGKSVVKDVPGNNCRFLQGANCPVHAQQVYTYKINQKFPKHEEAKLTMKYTLQNDKGETLACFKLPLSVKSAA